MAKTGSTHTYRAVAIAPKAALASSAPAPSVTGLTPVKKIGVTITQRMFGEGYLSPRGQNGTDQLIELGQHLAGVDELDSAATPSEETRHDGLVFDGVEGARRVHHESADFEQREPAHGNLRLQRVQLHAARQGPAVPDFAVFAILPTFPPRSQLPVAFHSFSQLFTPFSQLLTASASL